MVMRIKQTFYGWEYMEIGNLYYYIIYYIYICMTQQNWVCLKIGCTPKNGIVIGKMINQWIWGSSNLIIEEQKIRSVGPYVAVVCYENVRCLSRLYICL